MKHLLTMPNVGGLQKGYQGMFKWFLIFAIHWFQYGIIHQRIISDSLAE